jgi:hypothetical protein
MRPRDRAMGSLAVSEQPILPMYGRRWILSRSFPTSGAVAGRLHRFSHCKVPLQHLANVTVSRREDGCNDGFEVFTSSHLNLQRFTPNL